MKTTGKYKKTLLVAMGSQCDFVYRGGWRSMAGCPLGGLPREYPRWKSVYHYFRIWRQDGTWKRIHDTIRALLRRKLGKHKHPTAGCLDSQSVETTAVGGERGYDGGKLIKGRKRGRPVGRF